MKYDELNEKAKARARQQQVDHDTDGDWYRSVYEDAKQMGGIIGLEIGWGNKPFLISFAGFWSQGDGCCWTGHIDTKKFVGAVEAMKAETSDGDLFELAKQAEAIHEKLVVHEVSNRLIVIGEEEDWHFPDCVPGIRVRIEGNERYWTTRVDGSEDFSIEFTKVFNDLANSFAKWIYRSLEQQYEFMIDDKNTEATIREYDPDFDEEGNEI